MPTVLHGDAMPKPPSIEPTSSSPIGTAARGFLCTAAALLLVSCGEQPPALSPRAQPSEIVGADVTRGRLLVGEYGCVACHAVPGVNGPSSRVGPSLENMALRAYIGGVLATTPDNLVRWLLDPPAVDPRTAMPNMGINEQEARDIAAFLLTLY